MSSRTLEKTYIQSAPKQVMKKRTCRLVLRYYPLNKVLSPEKYGHSVLILFFLFFSDSQLLKDGSYGDKLQELNILEISKKDRRKLVIVKLLILFTCRSRRMLMIQTELCELKLLFQVMIAIAVKNPVMILDSQIQGTKLSL